MMNRRWGIYLRLDAAGCRCDGAAGHWPSTRSPGSCHKPAASGPAVVLVAGATGRTGRQILEQLRRDPRFAIRPMARDVAAARKEIGADYAWVAGDVTRPETLAPAMAGVSFVLCAIGGTERSGPNSPEFVDYGGVRNLTDAARAAGVRQLVLESSMGVGSGGGMLGMLLNLLSGDALKWKAKGEAHLRASGVPYTIVRPGGLVDEPGGQTGLVLAAGRRRIRANRAGRRCRRDDCVARQPGCAAQDLRSDQRRGCARGCLAQRLQRADGRSPLSQSRTTVHGSTSAYFSIRSQRLAKCGISCLSATHSSGTMTR